MERLRDRSVTARQKLPRARAGDLRANLDRLGRSHARSVPKRPVATLGAVDLPDSTPTRTLSSIAGSPRRRPPACRIRSRWRSPPRRATGARRCGWCCSRATTRAASSSTRTARAARPRSSTRTRGPRRAALGARRSARCASRGRSSRVADDESAAYFRTRPRGSQIGAWASPQSQVVASRAELEQRAAAIEQRFAARTGAAAAVLGRLPDRRRGDRVLAGPADRLHDRVRLRASTATAGPASGSGRSGPLALELGAGGSERRLRVHPGRVPEQYPLAPWSRAAAIWASTCSGVVPVLHPRHELGARPRHLAAEVRQRPEDRLARLRAGLARPSSPSP